MKPSLILRELHLYLTTISLQSTQGRAGRHQRNFSWKWACYKETFLCILFLQIDSFPDFCKRRFCQACLLREFLQVPSTSKHNSDSSESLLACCQMDKNHSAEFGFETSMFHGPRVYCRVQHGPRGVVFGTYPLDTPLVPAEPWWHYHTLDANRARKKGKYALRGEAQEKFL